MLRNATIKMKLLILSAVVSLAFIFILITEKSAIKNLNSLSRIDHNVEELQIKLLERKRFFS